MNTDADGGSSSVFSSAFCAGGTSASASSMIDDAAPPFERPIAGAVDDVAHLVDLDRPGVARLDDEHVGVDAAGDARAGGARAARVESDRPEGRALPVREETALGDAC